MVLLEGRDPRYSPRQNAQPHHFIQNWGAHVEVITIQKQSPTPAPVSRMKRIMML